ncbi:MAG TPA: 16S rRNA (guanine(527)-N(7))-methyltransferase RsmG [Geminicoccaceae bacterium]|nr:16S rRNA (guanine(527)-N(7))-methyltransferase RsmG [Geminicoccaceae bacterium]
MAATPLSPEAFAREMAGAGVDVSRETLARLEAYLGLLRRWQRAVNLVGAGTLADPWRRHILDCGQIAPHVPQGARTVLDLGSGAGLPGLVLALLGIRGVHLVESDQRKAQFLREAARITQAPLTVHAARIEQLGLRAGVVTARALAPLPRLLELAAAVLAPDGICLFLKGETVADELTRARQSWHMHGEIVPSLSGSRGVLLKLAGVGRAPRGQP